MPYVTKERRSELDWGELFPYNPGDLNYMITKICDQYLQDKGVRYEYINDIIGALECAKLEFYRRIAAPYENQKILKNGDVYDPIVTNKADPTDVVVTPASLRDMLSSRVQSAE